MCKAMEDRKEKGEGGGDQSKEAIKSAFRVFKF